MHQCTQNLRIIMSAHRYLFARPKFSFLSLAYTAAFFLLAFSFLLQLSCNEGENAKGPGKGIGSANHEKMIQILAELRKKIDVAGNRYASKAKIAECDSIIRVTNDPDMKLTAMTKRAIYYLEYGDENQAINLLEELDRLLVNNTQSNREILLAYLGVSYLRLAERTNCIQGHNDEACIMPIRGNGIHQDKAPSRKAVKIFEELLNLNPNDYDALWLLNIAYMTLGEYPKSVPPKWLIPGLSKLEYAMNPFAEIAADLGIQANNRSGGVITDDFNNDGYLDIITSAWDLTDPMHYFQNNGDGTFTDKSAASGLGAIMGGLNIQHTDYNNDGYLDIFVLRGAWQGQAGPYGNQPNSLLRNNGDGTFTDVTIDAGLLSYHPTQTATWNDFNRDGWLDLIVGNESYDPQNLHPCEIYINNGDGTFRDMAKDWEISITLFIKAIVSGDYDNDGWPDLFLSSMSGQRVLLRNLGMQGGKLKFDNVSEKAGFAKENYKSFPSWFFDYDNDGWLDIFVCNYEFEKNLSTYAAKEALRPSGNMEGKPNLYHNNGDGTFSNVTPSMGINKVSFAMGSNFGDVNNDGWLDFYLGTGNPSYQSLVQNRLFVNLDGKKFADATNSSRTGNLQKGHGVAFADMDNDGDQDIYAEMGGAFRGDAFPSSFYLNPGQNQNNWICLKLEGTKSNRVGIGAKITVKFTEGGKQRMVYRELNSGGSFGSSPFRREIGIGQAASVDEIIIHWPVSGITQAIKNIQPNQLIKIKEGQEGYETLESKKIVFKKADGSIPMCAPVQ